MCRIGRGFPVLTLQLIPWAFLFCWTTFSRFAFLHQSWFWSCCCQLSRCFLLVPKDRYSSAHCYQFGCLSKFTFTDVFFRVSLLSGLPCGNLSHRTRTCFDPVVANFPAACSCPEGLVRYCNFSTSSVTFPIPSLRMVSFQFPVQPGFSVSDSFKPDYVLFLWLPLGLLHFPCHLRQILLSAQNPFPASCCQLAFLFFFVIEDRTEFVWLL